MKKITFVIGVFLMIFVNAQKANVLIEYDLQYQYLRGVKSFLIADDETSYFFFTRNKNLSYEDLALDNFREANMYNIFIYSNNNEKLYQSMGMSYNESLPSFLAKDKIPVIEWKMTTEMKNILGYECSLAIGELRGRQYKVWFTQEIPITYFPWKLKGLPGAILEFEADDKNVLSGKVTQVVLNSKIKLPQRFVDVYINNIKSAIPYQDIVKRQNVMIQKFRNHQIANSSKGTEFVDTPLREGQLELTFQWDKDKK